MIDKSDMELVPRISDVSSTLRIRIPTYIIMYISLNRFLKEDLSLKPIYYYLLYTHTYIYIYNLLLSIILYFINYKR